MTMEEIFDVLIMGGGPAGLAAANTLVRQRHTVVVFDSGKYHNDGAQHMHNVPSWDHKSPKDFRAASRKNLLEGYQTVQFHELEVKTIKPVDDGAAFEATDSAGKAWRGRKVILATGNEDIMPDMEGYAECWVEGIFHCLVCHGYEERHAAHSGVLAIDDIAPVMLAAHLARTAAQLTPGGVTIYTNGSEADKTDILKALNNAKRFSVDTRRIKRLEKGSKDAEVTVHFEDGTSVTEGFLAHKPKTRLRGDLWEQLGVPLDPKGDIIVEPPFNQTKVKGVFAAGDCASLLKFVNQAMYSGALAGNGAAAQVQVELYQ